MSICYCSLFFTSWRPDPDPTAPLVGNEASGCYPASLTIGWLNTQTFTRLHTRDSILLGWLQ